MSFVVSKLLWYLVAPGNLLAWLAVAGAWASFSRHPRRARWGRWLSVVAASGFFLLAVLPVGSWLAQPLEDRFPRPLSDTQVDGIIMLGGAVNPSLAASRGEPSVNDAAERILAFAELARRHPTARLIFTGGSGMLGAPLATEVGATRGALEQAGLDTSRVLFEDKSRNTWENAVFTRRLVEPKPGERWLLVTSAMHMPRSVGLFRKVGWEVVAYPVDYRTPAGGGPLFSFELARDLDLTTFALHEWVGLLAYRLMGRLDEVLPGP